jgi:hypothetical protein
MNHSPQTIFVQIASYREPQLVPTIEDRLRDAKSPQNLRMGLCRQYHPDDGFDQIEPYRYDPRFRIIDVLHTVTPSQHPWRYDLLTEFEKETGIGVLLNTSFNVNGKPMLSRYADALKVVDHTRMDGGTIG